MIFALACALFSAGVTAEKQSGKPADNQKSQPSNLAKSVDGRNIEFASEAEKSSNSEALSAVKKMSLNIQKLKSDVIGLNKDLQLMEEQLLFPSNTKYSVFLSLNSGQFFTLESIKLKLDGKLVATHIYTAEQRQALARGGIQKLHITNLSEGKHTLTAFFSGIGPNGRPYKRASNLDFEKGPGSGYLELAVNDDGAAQEPVFELKQW
jgi:hypothetical protein